MKENKKSSKKGRGNGDAVDGAQEITEPRIVRQNQKRRSREEDLANGAKDSNSMGSDTALITKKKQKQKQKQQQIDRDVEDERTDLDAGQNRTEKKKKRTTKKGKLHAAMQDSDANLGDENPSSARKDLQQKGPEDSTRLSQEGGGNQNGTETEKKKKKIDKKKSSLQDAVQDSDVELGDANPGSARKDPKRRKPEDSTPPDADIDRKRKKAKKANNASVAAAPAGRGEQPNPPTRDDEEPTDGVPAFPAEEADHAETPGEAYAHLAPVLSFVASKLGVPPAKLRIYDPYYCAGSVRRHLAAAGFPDVYNRNEDFYAVQKRGGVPPHDVVVTNPPYSGDHVLRFLQFAVRNRKPWFLLVPNYVYMKDYFRPTTAPSRPMYLTPPTRYVYQSPKGVCNALGLKRKSGEHKTAPFQTFWFMGLEPAIPSKAVLQWWMTSNLASKTKCKLCKDTTLLPHDMRDSFDPLRKRPPKHQRKAMKKTHTADGRPLCRECGQVHGNCKHTRS